MTFSERIQKEKLELGQRIELADDVQTGLFARIRLGNRRRTVHFIWRREHKGERYYANLGPMMSGFGIKEARGVVERRNAELLLGEAEATQRSKVPTLREAWEGFREFKLAKKKLRPSTRSFYEFASKHFLKALDFVKINKITADDCDKLHTKLGRTAGHRTANATIALLGRVWDWSADRGHCGDRRNPTAGIERYTIHERVFDYDPDEVRRFFAAAQEDPLRDLWILLAYTGVRISNALAAHREQFDLEARTWTIPADSAKSKRPIVIQLVDEVVEIVECRGGGWLFPAKRSASGHRTNVAKDWKRLREAANLPHWKIHSLRKLFGTVARNFAGADKGLTADLLGHIHLESQKAYVNSTPEGVRRAMEATVAEMKRISR